MTDTQRRILHLQVHAADCYGLKLSPDIALSLLTLHKNDLEKCWRDLERMALQVERNRLAASYDY